MVVIWSTIVRCVGITIDHTTSCEKPKKKTKSKTKKTTPPKKPTKRRRGSPAKTTSPAAKDNRLKKLR